MDMDLHGIEFTWSNKRTGDECIQARLDRALISLDWTKDLFAGQRHYRKLGQTIFP